MNARGIPPAVYQVLHMLSYPGGTPSLAGGTPSWAPPILTWLRVPHPWLGGGSTPSLAGGGGYPIPGTPHSDLAEITPSLDWGVPILGYPLSRSGLPLERELGPVTGVPPGKGPGTSHWGIPWKGHNTSGSIAGWRWGTPPPPRCELTNKLKILPSPSFGCGR